jgi:hypothetical protein
VGGRALAVMGIRLCQERTQDASIADGLLGGWGAAASRTTKGTEANALESNRHGLEVGLTALCG